MAEFAQSWRAEILRTLPLIAPVRSFVYPQRIAGEEEALGRGALQLLVHPRVGGDYLVTCALGFNDPAMPTGVYGCPHPDRICAVAGGYVYLADTTAPEHCTLLAMKPVVEVVRTETALLFLGFLDILAWGAEGELWRTARLTSEGLRVTRVTAETLEGLAWDMRTDRELPFTVDLATGHHTGGVVRSS